MRPARSAKLVAALRPAFAFALVVSLGLHLVATSPVLLMWWLDREHREDPAGDEAGAEAGPAGNDGGEVAIGELAPVSVSIYVEPTEAELAAAAEAEAETETDADTEAGAEAGVGTPSLTPGARIAALKERMGSKTRGAKSGDASVKESDDAAKLGAPGKPPRGERKPCEKIDEITALGSDRWRVERDVVDYYAMRLRELEKHVGLTTHKGPDGKPDGARLYLPRCSLLRQAGLQHADIVNSINGRRVATLPDAIAAYLFLRNEENLTVELTRKDGKRLTYRYRLRK